MLPRYIASGVILSGLAALAYVYIQNPQYIAGLITPSSAPSMTSTAPKTAIVKTVSAVTKTPAPVNGVPVAVSAVETTYEQNTLTPSFAFMDTLQTYEIDYENALKLAALAAQKEKAAQIAKKKRKPAKKVRAKSKPKKPVQKKRVSKPVKPKKKKEVVTVPVKRVTTVPKKEITEDKIITVAPDTASQDELNALIKRFNHKKKPALSLFIANKYYNQGNYQESYTYAKETLKLNGRIEDAILIYAKSLVKLGRSEKAKAKLYSYIKQTHSIKAKSLLNKINKGTFK